MSAIKTKSAEFCVVAIVMALEVLLDRKKSTHPKTMLVTKWIIEPPTKFHQQHQQARMIQHGIA